MKLQLWRTKFFSSAGREVLIKAVVQAVPTYTMSVFRLPANLIQDLQALTLNFWWGGTDSKRKNHCTKWEKQIKVKGDGGLSFRDLECFSKALVTRQAWRILSNPDFLMARVLRVKYFSSQDFLNITREKPVQRNRALMRVYHCRPYRRPEMEHHES